MPSKLCIGKYLYTVESTYWLGFTFLYLCERKSNCLSSYNHCRDQGRDYVINNCSWGFFKQIITTGHFLNMFDTYYVPGRTLTFAQFIILLQKPQTQQVRAYILQFTFWDFITLLDLWFSPPVANSFKVAKIQISKCNGILVISSKRLQGIYDFRMGRVSGMEISSSQGLKKPPKISPREETLSSQGP